MKTKKTKKANLENLRTIFFQIGTILVLSAILVAFEWKSSVNLIPILTTDPGIDILEINIPRTPPKEEKLVQPPTPIEKIILVDDTEEIEDEPIFPDTEDYWNNPINIIDFEPVEEEVEVDFIRVEIKPTFLGREARYFRKYLAENVSFPVNAVESGISGTVYASFVIDKDGSVTNVKITRSIHPVIDQAVMDAINRSPDWEAGLQGGKYVRVSYNVSISFKLL